MNVKNNRRSQETKARVEAVFLRLLSEKHISAITVRELCDGAQITRTSFYGHYRDVYDLMDKVQERMTLEVVGIFKAEWDKSERDAYIAFIQVFRYMEQNRTFFLYFLRNADMKQVFASAYMTGLFGEDLLNERRLDLTFYIGGLNALLLHWLEGNCMQTPEEILEAVPWKYLQTL